MPRKTKDQKELEKKDNTLIEKNKKQEVNSKKITSKRKTTTKKKTATKKSTTTSKKTKNIKNTKSKETSAKKFDTVEYYDLPYRYNETTVKVLAQTPNTLFVYWDISDFDRENFKKEYGENFFEITKPILIIHNNSLGYSFEVEINDFANSWYIRTSEADCNYIIELGRKFKNQYENNYVYINSSNNMVSPNDHVLFENVNLSKVLFKNTKTNELLYKDFSSLNNAKGIDRLYNNIYDIYGSLYADEDLQSINAPSSSVFYLQGVKK